MTSTQVEYFLAAAQTLNFGVAADLVFTTRSSLSRQIAALEEELGAQLFARENNVLTLTTLGQEFYVRIQKLYVDYAQTLYEFSQLKSGMDGHINIGIMQYQMTDAILTEAVGQLLKAYPNAVIDVGKYGYADLAQGIMSGKIDIGQAFLHENIKIENGDTILLGKNQCCLAVPESLCPSLPSSIQVKDIPALKGSLPIIVRAADTYPAFAQPSMRTRIDKLPASLLADIRYVSSTDSVDMYLSTGTGVAFSNDQNVFQTEPKICLIPIDDTSFPPFEYGLLWSKKNTNPLTHKLIAIVKNIVRQRSKV